MNNRVSLDEKLAALQENDTHRKWSSMDDQRVCSICGNLISGHMIDIWQGGSGAFHFHGPSAACPGALRDWFYLGATRAYRSQSARSRLRLYQQLADPNEKQPMKTGSYPIPSRAKSERVLLCALSRDHCPPVRVQDLPGHIGGVMRSEKDEMGGDFIGLPGAL